MLLRKVLGCVLARAASGAPDPAASMGIRYEPSVEYNDTLSLGALDDV
jgi:actin-related protein 8, plant